MSKRNDPSRTPGVIKGNTASVVKNWADHPPLNRP